MLWCALAGWLSLKWELSKVKRWGRKGFVASTKVVCPKSMLETFRKWVLEEHTKMVVALGAVDCALVAADTAAPSEAPRAAAVVSLELQYEWGSRKAFHAAAKQQTNAAGGAAIGPALGVQLAFPPETGLIVSNPETGSCQRGPAP